MRLVLSCIALGALALAFPAAAQTTDWKVDVAKWSRPGDRIANGSQITITTPAQRASPSLGIAFGSLTLEPSLAFHRQENVPPFADPFEDDSFELGLNGYFRDHPRLMLLGKYMYRRAKKQDERTLFLEQANHLPDVSHGNRISFGLSCSLPLTNCFKR